MKIGLKLENANFKNSNNLLGDLLESDQFKIGKIPVMLQTLQIVDGEYSGTWRSRYV